jgi:hypothetical protein
VALSIVRCWCCQNEYLQPIRHCQLLEVVVVWSRKRLLHQLGNSTQHAISSSGGSSTDSSTGDLPLSGMSQAALQQQVPSIITRGHKYNCRASAAGRQLQGCGVQLSAISP